MNKSLLKFSEMQHTKALLLLKKNSLGNAGGDGSVSKSACHISIVPSFQFP